MDQITIFLTILGMALVTVLPRILPIAILSTRSLPKAVEQWLSFVPVAVLAALLGPCLLIRDQGLSLGPDNLFLMAALPTFLVAVVCKNFFLSVAVGMLCVAGARLVL